MKITKLRYGIVPLFAGFLLIIWAGGASAQMQPVRARITEAVDETNRVQLRGNVHPLARAEFDQGVVADSQPMNRMLLLLQRSPEQQAALSGLMEEQLTNGSPNYHNWLTPEQFGKQFGPVDADIQAVTTWLGSRGFQGIKMGPGRMVMEFSGTAGHVRNAFHTEMHHYLVNGEAHMANAADPQIPAALTPVVAGIRSLHNFKPKSHLHPVGTFRRDRETGRVEPLLTTTKGCGPNGSQPCFALGSADFAKIYSVPNGLVAPPILLDGTGQTIAIVGDSNIQLSDIVQFRKLFNLPGTNLSNNQVILNGPDPGLNADEGEADLDVEWSGAVAPNATVDFVVSEATASTAGFDLSALFIVENNLAPVMSESFGVCEPELGAAGNAFYNTLWEQAAAQGITVMVSAGDGGSDGCDDFNTATMSTTGISVSGTASTPFNVAVGGTDFDDASNHSKFWSTTNSGTLESALGYIPESTWNDSCAATATAASLATCNPGSQSTLNIVSGSGGPSAVNPKPTWQNGITPSDGFRDTPDVSLFASDGHNGSFYIVCQADVVTTPNLSCTINGGSLEFVGVGGTSASAPTFAGIMALINQKTGQRQGNANAVLYALAKAEAPSLASCNSSIQTNPSVPPPAACVFNDITKGNNSVPCAGGSPNCSSKTANTNGVLVNSAKVPAFTTGPGYDLATGLGSVNVANLATAWAAFETTLKASTTSVPSTMPLSLVSLTHGTQVTFNITVTGAGGTPSGEVSLLTDANPNPSSSPSTILGEGGASLSSGSATITTILPGGTYNISAHYAGDAAFGQSDSTKIPVVIKPEKSQLQLDLLSFGANNTVTINPTSLVFGSSYILRADILNSSGGPCQPFLQGGGTTGCATDATGTVNITDNGSLAAPNGGTFALNSQGHTENQPIQLPAGKQTLVATYLGDSSYIAPPGPATVVLTVTQAATATRVVPNVSSIASGGSVTLTATVSSNSNATLCPAQCPTGTVQFLNGSNALGAAATCLPAGATASAGASCTATLVTTISALGIPDTTSPWRPKLPPGLFWLIGCCAALYGLFLWKMPRARRRGYAYAGLVVFALAAAGIAGCGGGGGSSKTPQSKTVTITAKFIGDSNYTASSGTTSVTIQ